MSAKYFSVPLSSTASSACALRPAPCERRPLGSAGHHGVGERRSLRNWQTKKAVRIDSASRDNDIEKKAIAPITRNLDVRTQSTREHRRSAASGARPGWRQPPEQTNLHRGRLPRANGRSNPIHPRPCGSHPWKKQTRRLGSGRSKPIHPQTRRLRRSGRSNPNSPGQTNLPTPVRKSPKYFPVPLSSTGSGTCARC